MSVIWLNGAVGSGKTAVGRALAAHLPRSIFVDGDHYANPACTPATARWRAALSALLRLVIRRNRAVTLVIAYPLGPIGYRQLRTACGRAKRSLTVVNLATPLVIIIRGRGGRRLNPDERDRVRVMYAQGYHRRRFADVTVPNARGSPSRTARLVASLIRAGGPKPPEPQPPPAPHPPARRR